MKKALIKLGVMALVFILSAFLANLLLNRDSRDMTADLSPASLPIVYMNVNDEYINPLHGYTVEMEGNYLRGPITPLMANRSVTFKAELYDAVIAKVGFEVRPLDMSRLIEDDEITDFTYENNEITATAALKDLINDNEEYMLIIKLTTSSGNVIRYYARIINRAELSIAEKIDFVRDFSGRTFNKTAAEELKTYMESNSEGDNSSYAYVNIHSSFNQLTWGDLKPTLQSRKNLEIIDIDDVNACINMDYQVEISGELYNVNEYFRVQKGRERMYLMEYERTMNQIFDDEKNVIVNGKILHGIINEQISRIENENGSIYCFVQENSLFSYNESSNTMAKLYSFYDKDNADERTYYNAHHIKPLDVDSDGNVYFIVYGYMNRGKHEGQTGVSLYYYDAALNTIEEELYIPYYKSYQILEKEVESLSYLSTKGKFFVLIDGAVLNIDVSTKSVDIIQDGVLETGFFSSDEQDMIALQMGESVEEYTEIRLFRLNTEAASSIKASPGEIVVPLGFMESDLIYGTAKESDITTDEAGRIIIPMYSIKIQDESGDILKEYKQNGIYILGVEKEDNMIVLQRAVKDSETGEFVAAEDDQIMNNKTETKLKNAMGSVVTEDTETTYQTILCKDPGESNLKLTNPKEVVYEGQRSIALDHEDTVNRFYVYSKGDLDDIVTDASDAVNEAEESFGVVVDKRMAYIWESGDRKTSIQLDNLDISTDSAQSSSTGAEDESDDAVSEENQESSSTSSYAECLDIMLKCQGIYKDTKAELQGSSVINVLKENLDMNVLELSGCSLQAVLYYVSEGNPVMALTETGHAVLIVGYDSKNTIIYDPIEKSVSKKGLEDSKAWFEANGNRFITYIK